MTMTADDLRSLFLGYFAEREHKTLPSASLVPDDPTLLFTSAGMVQFKDNFWERTEPAFPRVATCQKCFRATDIDRVGKTAFHHTFFEMLGNFSFGDYFKEGSISFAWTFVTKELSIPPERLWVSVYEEDDEAYAIWKDLAGLPADRIVRLGKDHNWWGPVGNAGPCGPDSEIFYDTGEARACGPECLGVACDCNRFSEIWNLVFMQYVAAEDGSLSPLSRKSIDTGMGLERTAAVLQGVDSDFEIDSFAPLVHAIGEAASRKLSEEDLAAQYLIADHMRGLTFLIADGVLPGNEKQGYVLRRLLRSMIRTGRRLDLASGTLRKLVQPVVDTMGDIYPEVKTASSLAEQVIAHEEETFGKTLRSGERRLEKVLDRLISEGKATLPGDEAFELYDTYGFPLEITEEIAKERGIAIDREGFEKDMSRQKETSRVSVSQRSSVRANADLVLAGDKPTLFVGYERMESESELEDILSGDGKISRFVFPESPFYAEAGGQVADTGSIENPSRSGKARVLDVTKNEKGVFLHRVELETGDFQDGDRCQLTVDKERRMRIARNHTATHILHKALREVLGEHVIQAGSYVSDTELRFDFSHFEKMSEEEIARVEDLVNQVILRDLPVETEEMPLNEAKASGAAAHFEEEYAGKEKVRVVSVGDFSRELCGGMHVVRSGEIGLVKIVSEESVASGTRRIRALAGDRVLGYMRVQSGLLAELKARLGDDPLSGLGRLEEEVTDLRSQAAQASRQGLARLRDEIISGAERANEASLLSGRLDRGIEHIKQLADMLEDKARPAVVVLTGEDDGSALAVCKVSKGIDVDARDVLRSMTTILGGGGGGSPSFAHGGGSQVSKLDDALASGIGVARDALSR